MNKLIILYICVMSHSIIAASDSVRLIAQKEFPVDSLTKYQVVGLFLQKIRKLEHQSVKIVQYRTESTNRSIFAQSVLSMSDSDESLYWRTQLVSDGMRPPKTKKNERIVFKYLLRHPNCLGYVTNTEKIPKGLKEILVVK